MRRFRVIAALVLTGALAGFAPEADAAVLISIDKGAQRMSVAVDGELRWTWPVSTGRGRYDTPNGRYTAFRMEKEHYSKEWDDAPMPHSIFFTRIGHAIHGTNHTKRLGRPASHGCVRLAPEHAAMLFALVKKQGLPNTKVVIAGTLPPRAPLVAEADVPPAPAPVEERDDFPARTYVMPYDHGTRAARARARQRERAARAYAVPDGYERPRYYERPPVYQRRRARPAPRVTYDPHVEIIEETYVNGTWVRRRYYRRARPSDFYGWR